MVILESAGDQNRNLRFLLAGGALLTPRFTALLINNPYRPLKLPKLSKTVLLP